MLLIIFLSLLLFSTSNIIAEELPEIPESPCSCTHQQTIGTTGEETQYSTVGPFNSSSCYFIKGTLVINSFHEIEWEGLQIEMEEGAEILVESDFSIFNTYITACDVMWKGIRLSEWTNFFIYNSVIRSAEIGIYIPATQPGFICRYTKFIDDYIGIGAGSPFDVDPIEKMLFRPEIYGCEFYTDVQLPDPYNGQFYYPGWPSSPSEIPFDRGYAAIFLLNAKDIDIGKKNGTGIDRNLIHNMRNGILVFNSTSDIRATDIYDLEGTQPKELVDPLLDINQYAIYLSQSTSNIWDNTVDNALDGIFAEESNVTIFENILSLTSSEHSVSQSNGINILKPERTSIFDNNITNGWFGIYMQDVNTSFNISNNILTRNIPAPVNVGIFLRSLIYLGIQVGIINDNYISISDGHGALGINLVNVSHISVDNNDVLFSEVGGPGFQHRGIAVSGGSGNNVIHNRVLADESYNLLNSYGIQLLSSLNNSLNCNSIENFYSNINIYGPNPVSFLRANEISDAHMGLELVSPVMIGNQFRLIDNHRIGFGNIWNGNFSTPGDHAAFISGPTPVASAMNSLFIVNSEESLDFLPNPIGPSNVNMGNWFIDNPVEELTPTCPQDPDFAPDPDSLASLVLTTLEYEVYNDEMTWLIKADIYELILLHPELTTNVVLDSFFEAEELNPLGQLIEWQLLLGSQGGLEKEKNGLIMDSIELLHADIHYIDSILSLHPNDSVSWKNLLGLKIDSLSVFMDDWDSQLESDSTFASDIYTEISSDLSNLTTNNDLEEYMRIALIYKTEYLLGNRFSSVDSTEILDLANLCPWEGGRAVVLADELYSTIADSILIPSSDNCGSPQPFISFPNNINTNTSDCLNANPNPFTNDITIRDKSVIYELMLIDLSGQILRTEFPENNEYLLTHNNLSTGIYFILAKTKNGVGYKMIIKSY